MDHPLSPARSSDRSPHVIPYDTYVTGQGFAEFHYIRFSPSAVCAIRRDSEDSLLPGAKTSRRSSTSPFALMLNQHTVCFVGKHCNDRRGR